MYLQYLRKDVRDEVDFLHADEHQSFLQVDFNFLQGDTITIYGHDLAFSQPLK